MTQTEQSPISVNPPTYGRRVAVGMAWAIAGVLVGKLAASAGQVALGWLLTKEDYGLYAWALSLGAFAGILRDGGIDRIAMQRGGAFASEARGLFLIGLAFRSVSALCTAVAAAYIATRGQQALAALVFISGIAFIFGAPGPIYRAKLAGELRFRDASALGAAVAVLRQVFAVVLAICGLGAMSLMLSSTLSAAVDSVASRRVAGPLPAGGKALRQVAATTLPASRWLILTGACIVLTTQGDYLVLGFLTDTITTGIYYFGFQFSVALVVLFDAGFRGVLVPTFSRLRENKQRQAAAYTRALRLLAFMAAPAAIGAAVVAAPLVHLLWGGKWDSAIPVVQVFAIAMLVRLISPLGMSLIEARGQWGLQAGLLITEAVGTIAAAVIGAKLGGAPAIALAVATNQVLLGTATSLLAGRAAGLPMLEVARCTARPIALTLGIGGVVYFAGFVCDEAVPGSWVAVLLPSGWPYVLLDTVLAGAQVVALAASFALSYALGSYLLMRDLWMDAMALLPTRLRGRP